MSLEDQPTQQLRRPTDPPMPAGLNPTRPQPTAPVETADDGGTDVLSLDNLFEGQTAAPKATTSPTPPAAATTQLPVPAEPLPAEPLPAERRVPERRVAERRVTDRRVAVVPVTTSAAPEGRQQDLGQRLRGDSTAAMRGGMTQLRDWFTTGDHLLIVATILVALMLVLVVALI
jgi:hypothetical protein